MLQPRWEQVQRRDYRSDVSVQHTEHGLVAGVEVSSTCGTMLLNYYYQDCNI